MKYAAYIFAAIVLATGAFFLGANSGNGGSTERHVSSFNEGFSDAKEDDCAMGHAKACDWIADQH